MKSCKSPTAPEQLSPAQKEQVKAAEGRRILNLIGPQEQVIATDIQGEMLSSPQFAAAMDRWMGDGKSRFCFVIGGSLGLSGEVLERADFSLSFGSATFSHQIFRVMLLEQLYRALKSSMGNPITSKHSPGLIEPGAFSFYYRNLPGD